MDPAEPHQAIDFPVDPFFIPYQPHNGAQQNAWVQAWVPPAPNGQPEGHQEDIPPPVRGFARLGGMQDPRRLDVACRGVVDYHPQQLLGNPAYIYPDVGPAQGIPEQAHSNAPVDIERNPFGHVPQNNAPGFVHAAFPHPFVHRIPTPNQAGAENLRRLASRYLHQPDAQVGMVSVEAAAGGQFKVVIILESHDVF
ncbi:hypothetical protein BJV77DRAFT_396000 [Russula vinacea]|nr:hypothetical protein BJV77DRAFT_396000 [Russula vinacea]